VILAATFVLAGGSALLAATNATPLEIKTQFFYENDSKEIKPLDNNSVLKSGQNVGVAFRSQENCFIYIFWQDSTGKMGVLFPNPALTEDMPQVTAGKTYWLPSKDGERWYVLDENPGTETIYFVAGRVANPKLEELSRRIQQASGTLADAGGKPEDASEIKRELNTMGFAQVSVPKGAQQASYTSKEQIFNNLDQTIRVSGAEALFRVQFQHASN
jgi:hypothetical protein